MALYAALSSASSSLMNDSAVTIVGATWGCCPGIGMSRLIHAVCLYGVGVADPWECMAMLAPSDMSCKILMRFKVMSCWQEKQTASVNTSTVLNVHVNKSKKKMERVVLYQLSTIHSECNVNMIVVIWPCLSMLSSRVPEFIYRWWEGHACETHMQRRGSFQWEGPTLAIFFCTCIMTCWYLCHL
jgi:hypothetical protein